MNGIALTGDLEAYQQRVDDLERQLAELTDQLKDNEEELDAARAINRELTAELNRGEHR